MEVLTKKV